MNRHLRQTAYVNRGFDAVCLDLDLHSKVILRQATGEATDQADHLVLNLDHDLGFFNPDETVTLRASSLTRTDAETASMRLQWRSDHGRRILPALDAQLRVNAIIPSGPSALTALAISGIFTPPPLFRRRGEEALFKQKLVDVVIHRFVNSVAEAIDRSSSIAESEPGSLTPHGVGRPGT